VSFAPRVGARSPALGYDLYTGGPRPPLQLQGSQLVRADGEEVQINGINWCGPLEAILAAAMYMVNMAKQPAWLRQPSSRSSKPL
jgi:hypothetical protein